MVLAPLRVSLTVYPHSLLNGKRKEHIILLVLVVTDSGVAAGIKQLDGAIGYLNYGYVNGGKFQQVALQNAGNFVKANAETSAAGLIKLL